ncbi:MAG: DUF3078 domain-containing protein [Candidatus Zixiibacteriota bacterium]|nr:MAG: DUF3078 domain-containing protein [candidate division Zixibacteria bacterium]
MSKRLMLSILTLLLLTVQVVHAEGDDSTALDWKKALTVDLTTTQTSYSDSWVGGEAGSFNWVANVNGNARRQLSPLVAYSTILKLSFGQTYTQDAETKQWKSPQKSTDLIDWDNVARFTLNGFVDPYAAFRLESQFFDASVPRKKRYFSPLKLTESAGLARKFYEKKDDYITSRLGFGLREIIRNTIVGDTALLQTEDSTEVDGGIESVTDVILTLSDKLHYTGKLTMYKALFFSESDTAPNDDWKSVDINWENQITANLSKIIAVSFYTQLLYDKQIRRRIRLKETMALGFTFKLF